MFINGLMALLIFGYAGWTLYRFVKKSRQGQCATCSIQKTCQTKCSGTACGPSCFGVNMQSHASKD
ncbi:FeoB-associated Cys-rich membrane protein [Paenibacillaceae bacterium T2]|uniref:FeoB-associated Cys-rich membrane protein n=1 Tax=Ferviditalea candida TaxID=3108399 RepID=A0ABU5ZGS0_9BACL|nr:FeoB-associated Cys-rich membrane protein [Paenibacillaceae bacterium T2]